MQIVIKIIFILELSLLFTHEMDAIRRQEWKMFIFLKNLTDEKAYKIFLLLHIPLYTAILLVLFSSFMNIGNYIVDIFLIIHMLIHFLFRKNPANELNGKISKGIINSAGLFAIIHLLFNIIYEHFSKL